LVIAPRTRFRFTSSSAAISASKPASPTQFNEEQKNRNMDRIGYAIVVFFTLIGAVFLFISNSVDSMVARWVWGILAAAVFIFTIYMVIDSVFISKHKPDDSAKDFAEFFGGFLANQIENNSEEFLKGVLERAKQRDILFDSQKPESKDFGYSLCNPVMTSTIFYSDQYLKSLRTLDGKPFTWERLGSDCAPMIGGVEDVIVDVYKLYLDGKVYTELFLCPYGRSSSYVPHGLTLAEKSDGDDLEMV
jgi:hypothetical protein